MEVSRRHCSFELVQGVVILTDLGSTNGTFVDGQRIQGPLRLRDGAEIRVGTHSLRYTRTSRVDEESTYVGGLSDWLAGPSK
jgi:pSer/pThr/pTyr-binding forkhead associated (FHA) protein